jgi:hypothetical protein
MTAATVPVQADPAEPRESRLAALRAWAAALRKVADYRLNPEIDSRLTELGEGKEFLDGPRHAELAALSAFARRRGLEKLEALAALRALTAAYPELEETA